MAEAIYKKTTNNGLMEINQNSEVSTFLMLPETKQNIANILGKNRVQTFIGSALTVFQDNKLKDVEPTSLFNCLLKAASYNLPIDPNLGYAYPVPYETDGVKVAQFQMGVKGLHELATRSGQFARLGLKEVREGELKGLDFFGEEIIEWIANRNNSKIIGYMAAYELINGLKKRIYMPIDKIEEHAKQYSKAHQYALKYNKRGSDIWSSNFGAMAEKTILKAILKYAPKSIELQNALMFDQSVIIKNEYKEIPFYIDNDPIVRDTVVYDISKDIQPNASDKNEQNKASESFTNNSGVEMYEGKPVSVIDYGLYKDNPEKYKKISYDKDSYTAKVILKDIVS